MGEEKGVLLMQMLLFRCRCGGELKEINPEHTSFMWDSELFCSLDCILEAQTIAKCRQLAIPYESKLFGPHPTGDP